MAAELQADLFKCFVIELALEKIVEEAQRLEASDVDDIEALEQAIEILSSRYE